MQLYTYWRSSAAYRVRIALNLKGLDYQSVPINLVESEHRKEDYLATNPQGLVPALTHEQALLTQSMAIIEYLEETQPLPALLPGNALERARVRAFSQAIACDMHPLCNLRVLRYLKRNLGKEQQDIDTWYLHWMEAGFQGLEKLAHASAGRYFFGDSVSLADICLVPQIYNARRFKFDMSIYPTLFRIDEALCSLDAFQAARPENQADAAT